MVYEITGLSNLQASFDAVKENNGCAGVDRITVGEFDRRLDFHMGKLRDELNRKVYSPLPLMQILVAKKNGEPRKLCIPTVRDRVVHRTVLDQIGPVLEKEFEACSYAYRKGRSVKQVVYQIQQFHNEGFRWVVNADSGLMDEMSSRIERIVDPEEDSVRIYSLCASCERNIKSIGTGEVTRDADVYVL